MNILRAIAMLSFVAGAGLLTYGFLQSRGDDAGAANRPAETFDVRVTVTVDPAATAVPSAEVPSAPGTAEPTATAAPFNGAVARFLIPRFNVDSRVEAIGILPNNQLDTPHDPRNTGWYEPYDKPGFRGNAVFSAHVDYYPDIRGPFFNLSKLRPDDEVVVVMEDGTTYRYRVVLYKRYPVEEIPMAQLIWPQERPSDREWITLITCGGRFSGRPGEPGEYLDRDVVVAERYE
jgi:hypothetical protein